MSGAHGSNKPPPPDSAERYFVLQRKVDDLEKIHKDGKKVHQAEIERFKLELARLQKTNTELTDRLDKQKKQREALELRVDELKKSANSDKAEIKDLGVKLRMSEHQRSQMTAKHGDMADMKKALTKQKDEVKERDKKVADLEKSLAAEKKKREMVEGQLKDMKTKSDSEAGVMKAAVDNLKMGIVTARDELQSTQLCLETAKRDAESREEALLGQLQEHRMMLDRVAEQYGMLASSTVSKSVYERLQRDNITLQLQAARFSRKLGNTEGQVSELAHLIRQREEDNQLLRRCIKHLEEELSSYLDITAVKAPLPPSYVSLDETVASLGHDQEQFEKDVARVSIESLQLEAELYRLKHDEVLSAYAEADAELQEAAVVASKLQEVQLQRDTSQELLQAMTVTAESLRSSSHTLKQQVAELESKLRTEVQKASEALKKEKETVSRLTTTVQKSRMAEDGMRAEIEQLTTELTDAEGFQEAYYSLSEELEGLLARNALAEDEAQRLSNINAEILGHQNPMQRILYVEKIRNELADTKQKLLVSTRKNEAVAAQNQDLQNELDTYKSVTVPLELKPRTKMIRMTRPPLANLNKSILSTGELVKPAVAGSDSIAGDMTLDEML